MLNVKKIFLMIGLAAISTSTIAKNKCDESVIAVNTEQGSICGVTQKKYQ
ncbi:hypothetical protein OAO18_01570 [Francisellaceae bacterium]|nr:hypothetical protein [Francisellaceae bacterium]